MVNKSKLMFNIKNGQVSGPEDKVIRATKFIKDTKQIYDDINGMTDELLNEVNYRVEVYKEDELEGGLQFGTSYLYPGTVNGEFFMTKGHFHEIRNRAEFYFCIEGKGLLLLMDEDGTCRVEEVEPNSLHYIPGNVAHRLVNIGEEIMIVGACWNSDAGHDYGTIEDNGFTVKVVKSDKGYTIIKK